MLSLKACLEEVARLGPGYVVNECGCEWEARELLAQLATSEPRLFTQPVYFLRPDRYGDGAIYECRPGGEVLSDIPLYTVEHGRTN